MDKFRLFYEEDFQTMPWRNGQGSTTELIAYPADEKDFHWRLSMAQVNENGPFSNFSGYDRTLILIQGHGVLLKYGDRRSDRLAQQLEMARFEGDWQTEAELINGPITDFNVMTKRNQCSAVVNCLAGGDRQPLIVSADHLLIYALQGDIEITAGANHQTRLPEGALMQVDKVTAGEWSLSDGKAICVQINYKAG